MRNGYTLSCCIVSSITFSTTVVAVGSVASGLCLLLAPEEPSTYSGGNFVLYPAVALFMTALAALLASFVGCWGVVRDTKMALYVFSVAALMIVVVEATSAGVVFAFAYSNQISDQLNSTLTKKVLNYSINDTSSDVDTLQKKYDCCGVHSYLDWRGLDTNWKEEVDKWQLAPHSCCEESFSSYCNCTTNERELNQKGCEEALLDRLKPLMDAVLGISITGAVLEVVASFTAYHGASVIRKYEHYDVI